jgi:anaerobic selenocysteine-containing dehydrogenase
VSITEPPRALESVGQNLREAHSYCRICANFCGVTLKIDGDDRIVSILGDRDNASTQGYACVKGRNAGEMHRRPDRILHPLKRGADGSFAPISLDLALDEIAEQVSKLVDEHGPHSVAGFLGTTGYFNVPASEMLIAWLAALGSRSFFSSFTIDCSSKAVTAGRLGSWGAGKHPFASSEVWMAFGNNPFVSLSGQAGMSMGNPAKDMKEAKARGMKLIVVDPRETETARHATVFLQTRPGEDPAVVAGIMRILFVEGLWDSDFCDRYASGVQRLRAAVEPFAPQHVQQRSGVDAEKLREAALLWGGAGKRGGAGSATGISMSPYSNLVDHLVESLNVLCGRYVRAGEVAPHVGPILPRMTRHAEVVPPRRPWDDGHKSRVGDFGLIPGINPRGELPSAILAEEIMAPGQDQIRCLFVEGGNPAMGIPDQPRVVRALSSLDLMVTIDPFMTATARLAHYILPPKLMFERPDIPMLFGMQWRLPNAFVQYTPAIVDPPARSELVDDPYVYWALAKRLGLTIDFCGTELTGDVAPTNEELIELLVTRGEIPFGELESHPHGKVYDDDLEPLVVQPARSEATGRFDLLPDDVFAELTDYERHDDSAGFTHRLAVRRMRHSMNGQEPSTPTPKYNPAYMSPADMADLGLAPGDQAEIQSDYSSVTAIVEPDDRLRSGVVSMSHCYGGLPGEDEDPERGASTGRLIDARSHFQAINAMPTMSGLPVRIVPAAGRSAFSPPPTAANAGN